LPGANQDIFITNAGVKTIIIDSETSLAYPQSLRIGSLTISSPHNTTNTLLMSGAGLETPLVIGDTNDNAGSLFISDSNSVFEIESSALAVNGSIKVFGKFNQNAGSQVSVGGMDLGGYINWRGILSNTNDSGTYNLSGGYLATSSLGIYNCTDVHGRAYPSVFNQTGGYHTNGSMELEGNDISILDTGWIPAAATCVYNLSGGTLVTGNIGTWYSTFNQSGGTNIAGTVYAQYAMSGGHLIAQNFNGGMQQTGGTNYSQLLGGWGYSLSEGMVVASNLSLSGITFAQSGGVLIASNIQLEGGTFQHGGGKCVAPFIKFDSGTWQEQSNGETVGQMQLGPSGFSIIKFPSNNCVLRFADSSSLTWSNSGILSILNWSGSLTGGGSNQIFFGTNSSGLTPQQLGRVQFQAPAGLAWGYYLAKMLPTGEIVPGDRSYLDLLPAPFFTGESSLSNGWYYLPTSNGSFGYYNLYNFPLVYHEDMGWEYFIDAANAKNGGYFYDYSDSTWFYTEPGQFPYIYDFHLNAWLYYSPAESSTDRYTSNPRWFFNLSTQTWISHL
jgi:hypothetical protein